MSRLKITKGKAVVKTFDKYGPPPASYWVNIGEHRHSVFSESPCKKEDMELIADAFNTANETDKLPSEIKKERDELMNLAKEISVYSNSKSLNKKAKELINKIKDNE